MSQNKTIVPGVEYVNLGKTDNYFVFYQVFYSRL